MHLTVRDGRNIGDSDDVIPIFTLDYHGQEVRPLCATAPPHVTRYRAYATRTDPTKRHPLSPHKVRGKTSSGMRPRWNQNFAFDFTEAERPLVLWVFDIRDPRKAVAIGGYVVGDGRRRETKTGYFRALASFSPTVACASRTCPTPLPAYFCLAIRSTRVILHPEAEAKMKEVTLINPELATPPAQAPTITLSYHLQVKSASIKLSMNDFNIVRTIGRGSFGKVRALLDFVVALFHRGILALRCGSSSAFTLHCDPALLSASCPPPLSSPHTGHGGGKEGHWPSVRDEGAQQAAPERSRRD